MGKTKNGEENKVIQLTQQQIEDNNEIILFDRLEKIKEIIGRERESNFYVGFSGGKDSTVLSALIDMAIPNNTIPRVFIDTGLEYQLIKKFVLSKIEIDSRFIKIKPEMGIGKIIKIYGYPFKSKLHSEMVYRWQNQNKEGLSVQSYITGSNGKKCPNKLAYQFTDECNLKISNKCCDILKKKPIDKWSKENNRPIAIVGIRKDEGGIRSQAYGGCILNDKNGFLKKFMPLFPVTDEWIEWFVDKYNIQLCELYYPPYNFKRTGCKMCPFALKIKNELQQAYENLHKEYEGTIKLWKPVFDEYIRLRYRITKYPHQENKKKEEK